MSVKHLPKIFLNKSDQDSHYSRLGMKKLDRKARKLGFKTYKDLKEYVTFLKELGQPQVIKALYILDLFNLEQRPATSGKQLSNKDLVRTFQKLGMTKKEAKAHLRGGDRYEFV